MNRVLNLVCTGGAGTPETPTCNFAPTATAGRTTTYNPVGVANRSECTYWAAAKWKEAVGTWSHWWIDSSGRVGNAYEWDTRAKSVGWRVTDYPARRSIVVFDPNVASSGPIGHVAWVEDMRWTSSGAFEVRLSEQNWPRGSGPRSDRWVRHVSGMSYIQAPPAA